MSKNINITFEAIAIKGKVGYASDYDRNGLFKVDLDSNKCEYLGVFENESIDGIRIHCDAIWIDSRVYFIPASGNEIDVFYPDENRIETISIKLPSAEQYSFYNPKFKFVRAVKIQDCLWLVPCTYPGIVKLDTKTNTLKVFDGWIQNCECFFRRGVLVYDKKIIAANGINNSFLVFDTDKQSGEIRKIGKKNKGMMSVCESGGKYWFAPRLQGAVLSLDLTTDEIAEYDEYPVEFEAGRIVFSNLYSYDGRIVFMPAESNSSLIFENNGFYVNKNIKKQYNDSMIEFLFETEKERYFREISNGHEKRKFKVYKESNVLESCDFYYLDDGEMDNAFISYMTINHRVILENREMDYQDYIRGLIHLSTGE